MDSQILINAQDAIIAFDLKGKVVYCNPSSCKLFEYKRHTLLGMEYGSLIRDKRMEFDQLREAILFNEPQVSTKFDILSQSEKKKLVSAQFSPVKDKEGKITGISAFFRKVNQSDKVASKAQALVETAPDAMVIVNSQGQIVLVNAQTENQFGYSKEELIGNELEMLIPDKYIEKHQQNRKNFAKQPKPRSMGQGMELFGKRKDGSVFPVEISLSPLKTEDGLFVSAAIRNITDRKKAENKFKGLLESAPDAIILADKHGNIQLANEQVVNIFGYSKKELIGNKIEMLVPMRYHHRHTNHRDEFFHSAETRPMASGLELSGVRKSGEEFPVEISLSPLETEDGAMAIAVIRDTSEKAIVKKELQDFNKKLQVKNKELEQFAFVASHDLQEPLQTVMSFTEFLSENYGPHFDETGRKSMQYITEATGRMRQLIKGLLDYSRLGRERKPEMVDGNSLISNIKVDLGSQIKATNAKIYADNLPHIKGNYTELRILFQNIITNAIKFHKEGVPPEIQINVTKKSDHWLFCIKDNGIGIEKKFKERIFIIFQRLHARKSYDGTGIGLAHCQKIVELHGGKIWVQSELGQGSSFLFTIPI
ncbi:PAS domain S-box protein [Echinicola rosea]|uniref:histidine kinase n=1 Tax=Echinicola rosea TaxID=1807691 RepID=A0ABQ1UVW9_9BACT|nr:PAS domain S-box protein [Echinicola rosea]GGF28267.1 hypothetical protein GCM10011339_15590 [Echinicola rosea]